MECPLCAKSGHWAVSADRLIGAGVSRITGRLTGLYPVEVRPAGRQRGSRDEQSDRVLRTNVTLIQIKYSKFGDVTSSAIVHAKLKSRLEKKLDRADNSRRARTVDRNDATNVAAATVSIGNHRNTIRWIRSHRSLRGQASGADCQFRSDRPGDHIRHQSHHRGSAL